MVAMSEYAAADTCDKAIAVSSLFWAGTASKVNVKMPVWERMAVLVHVGTGAVTVTVALAGDNAPPVPVHVTE